MSEGEQGRGASEREGLRHLYGDRPVIEGLTFSLAAGQAIALVGPNGAGKTTVLKCIVGSAEPAAGDILLDGVPIDERAEAVRRDVATLLDDLDFFPDLTAAEHLDLLARAHGNPSRRTSSTRCSTTSACWLRPTSCRGRSPRVSAAASRWRRRWSGPASCWSWTSRRPGSTWTASSGCWTG